MAWDQFRICFVLLYVSSGIGLYEIAYRVGDIIIYVIYEMYIDYIEENILQII